MGTEPVTILYLLTELEVGGAERSLYEIARRIDRKRFRPIVASLRGTGPLKSWFDEENIPVHPLEVRPPLGLGGIFRLVRLLRRDRVTILHSFLFHPNVIGRLAGGLARTPIVISSARVAEPTRPWRLWLEGLTSPLMDVETCVSDSVRRFMHARAHIPWRKLVTIRNGVDFSRFTLGRTEARAALNLPGDVPVVLFVGRFEHQKGVDLLPSIAKTVLAGVPSARFLLVGAGPLQDAVQQEFQRLGISNSVEFLGKRDDIPTLLAASDVLILPSRWEGLANVILEAHAARTPVVATDVEGTQEVIQTGVTGIVVPPEQPDLFAQAILDLLRDPEKRQALASAAYSRAGECFSVEQMAHSNHLLYEQFLGQKRPV